MSFNVGNSFITAQISSQRLHNIRDNSSPPETSLWERIKEFFFSTHQREALDCVHRLYHSADYEMSSQDIRAVFIKLQNLASPGHRDKFIIDSHVFADTYKINGLEILSIPKEETNDISEQKNDIWHDCLSHYHAWYDCHESGDIWSDCEDDVWNDCQDDTLNEMESESISDDEINIITADEISTVPEDRKSKEDTEYINCIWSIACHYRVELGQIGTAEILSKLGIWRTSKGLVIAHRIAQNLNSENINVQTLKKDISTLLKVSGVIELIPNDIITSPEFAVIQKMNAQAA